MWRLITVGFVLFAFVSIGQREFPANWLGVYSGKMVLGYEGRPADTLDVVLDIHEIIADSVWSHKMTYRSARFGDITKDYLIRKVRKDDMQHYLLDEQNGIAMPLTLMNDCFYGNYDVMDMRFINTLRLTPDGLLFDLFAASNNSKKTDVIEEEGETIQVDSFTIGLHQTAFLTKE